MTMLRVVDTQGSDATYKADAVLDTRFTPEDVALAAQAAKEQAASMEGKERQYISINVLPSFL